LHTSVDNCSLETTFWPLFRPQKRFEALGKRFREERSCGDSVSEGEDSGL